MRIFIILAAATLLVACSAPEKSEPSYSNARGSAYEDATKIREMAVLPVLLPDRFTGHFTEQEEALWRKSWPDRGADIVSDVVTEKTEPKVWVYAASHKPYDGYYMVVEVTHLHIGSASSDVPREERRHELGLTARIVNETKKEVVVELDISTYSDPYETRPFDAVARYAAHEIANWFNDMNRR